MSFAIASSLSWCHRLLLVHQGSQQQQPAVVQQIPTRAPSLPRIRDRRSADCRGPSHAARNNIECTRFDRGQPSDAAKRDKQTARWAIHLGHPRQTEKRQEQSLTQTRKQSRHNFGPHPPGPTGRGSASSNKSPAALALLGCAFWPQGQSR